MSKFFTAKITGLQSVINRNNAFIKSISDNTDALLNRTASNIESKAKSFCKVASISDTITAITNGKNDYEIDAGDGLENPAIAAYTEFGTGNYAASLVPSLPEDWRNYAQGFYISGLGRLPSAPFMYPAFASETTTTIDDVQQIISDASN